MFTGKMYAIWDPVVVTAGLRAKSLSAAPHILDGSRALAQLSDDTMKLIAGPDGNAAYVDHILTKVIPPALKGEGLQRMNAVALPHIAERLSKLADKGEIQVPNVWLWLRELMMSASCLAVYGKEDPLAGNPELEQAMW